MLTIFFYYFLRYSCIHKEDYIYTFDWKERIKITTTNYTIYSVRIRNLIDNRVNDKKKLLLIKWSNKQVDIVQGVIKIKFYMWNKLYL